MNLLHKPSLLLFVIIFLTGLILPGQARAAQDLTARQIMEKVEKKEISPNRSHDMVMTLIEPDGGTQERVFKVFSKSSGTIVKRLMLVKDPARLKDTGFLIFDHRDGKNEDEQWIYLPSIGKHKRIAATQRDDSFMGSDLNHSDLIAKQINDYRYQVLKETRVKDRDVWLIESTPVSASVIEKTGYQKSILAVDKKRFIVLRIKAWTRDEKIIRLHDYDSFVKIGESWVPQDIFVVSRVGKITRHMTRMKIKNIKVDNTLPDDLFTVRTLIKGLSGIHHIR